MFFSSILFGIVFLCSAAGLKLIQNQIVNQSDEEGSLNLLISDQLHFSVLGTFIVGILFLFGGIGYRLNASKGKWAVLAGIVLFLVGTAWSLIATLKAAGSSTILLTGIGFWLLFSAVFTFMGFSILKQPAK